MPEPEPTPPTPPKPKSWKDFVPSNWQQIVSWLILSALMWVFGRLTGTQPDYVPPPLPIFQLTIDDDLSPEQLKELEDRGIKVHRTGWRAPTPSETEATLNVLQSPRFADTPAGKAVMGADGDALVWRLANKGRGAPIPTRDQGQVGSCVSFGFAAAVEYTMAAQSAIGKVRQDLPDIAQEVIYAGSRVEVNGGRVPFSGDGSTGAWGAKWLETVGGALKRGQYGSIDLGAYDVQRCKQWGDRGVPDELEPLARNHKAKCTLVASAADAKKALQQGYAISVCSNQGFAERRDADGFARAQGNWAHCQAIIGYRADRPGFLILNSWGPNWISGPKGPWDDIPDGSYWAEESVVDRMLRGQDSFAVANAEGFQNRKINWEDWIVIKPKRVNVFDPLFAIAP